MVREGRVYHIFCSGLYASPLPISYLLLDQITSRRRSMVDAVELHHNSVVAKKLRVTIEWTRTIQRIDMVIREVACVDVAIASSFITCATNTKPIFCSNWNYGSCIQSCVLIGSL